MRETKLDEPMLEWFEYGHLPEGPIRHTSARFAEMASRLTDSLPRTPERTVALRKLLESKDAAVRCAVAVARSEGGTKVDKPRQRVDSDVIRIDEQAKPIATFDPQCDPAASVKTILDHNHHWTRLPGEDVMGCTREGCDALQSVQARL